MVEGWACVDKHGEANSLYRWGVESLAAQMRYCLGMKAALWSCLLLAALSGCPEKRPAPEPPRPTLVIVVDTGVSEARGPFIATLVDTLATYVSDRGSVVVVGSEGSKVITSVPIVGNRSRLLAKRLEDLQRGEAPLLQRFDAAASRPSARRDPLLVLANTSKHDTLSLRRRAARLAGGPVHVELVSLPMVAPAHRPPRSRESLERLWLLRVPSWAHRP